MGFTIPIRDVETKDATLTIRHLGVVGEERIEGRRQLPGGGFIAWGRGDALWVEASLPKRAGADNVAALPLAEAREAIEDLHREALLWAEADKTKGGHSWQDAAVKRIDAVRDFDGVKSIPLLLDGLSGVPLKGRVKRRRFADVERGKAETLTVANSVWGSTLYDKHAETEGLAPEGRVRFEARMRSDLLTSQFATEHGGAIRCFRDMEEERMQQLRRGMFERVGYDREVAAGGRIVETLRSSELSVREQRELWAFLTMPSAGADPGFGKKAAAKYRRLAEELGVTIMPRDQAEGAVVMCLDYERGTEVVRCAA